METDGTLGTDWRKLRLGSDPIAVELQVPAADSLPPPVILPPEMILLIPSLRGGAHDGAQCASPLTTRMAFSQSLLPHAAALCAIRKAAVRTVPRPVGGRRVEDVRRLWRRPMIVPRHKRTTDEEFGYLDSKELEDPLLKQGIAKAFSKLASVVGILVGLVIRPFMLFTRSFRRPPTPSRTADHERRAD
jgi:hypothetical protein